MPYIKPIPTEFKIGDIVRLKSGGPEMTIIRYDRDKEMWECKWFTTNYAGAQSVTTDKNPTHALQIVSSEPLKRDLFDKD